MQCDIQVLYCLKITLDGNSERITILVVLVYFFHAVTLKERKTKEKSTNFIEEVGLIIFVFFLFLLVNIVLSW